MKKTRRVYDDRISNTVGADGWTAWEQPIKNGYRMACCDCGLIHEMNFRVQKGIPQFQAKRNNRATAAMRRGKRYARIKKALAP